MGLQLRPEVSAKLVFDTVYHGFVSLHAPCHPLHSEENAVVASRPEALVEGHLEKHVAELLGQGVKGADSQRLEHTPPKVYAGCGEHAKESELGGPGDFYGYIALL
eukprot:CAMPEP_0197570900 /NCGR_PEP_ID=MMETSP1320-20131121/41516_1 /TAXON_ID=91990 /ORGANISM="Bolidomonas sp., Strain RCC2347" /LENGTH=105 /DNA_ID=CAMNT_0043133367 /DNA_START=134 /DNA_END=451 /DNA_ORIENTATION=-